MPQLDLATYPSQIFWLIIFFVSLFSFIKLYVAPSIESLVTIRNNKIEKDLNEASQARGEVEKLRKEYENIRQQTSFTISEMLEGELTNYNKQSIIQASNINLKIEELTKNVEEEIKQQKTKYKEELENEMIKYTIFLIKKISGLNITPEQLIKYKN